MRRSEVSRTAVPWSAVRSPMRRHCSPALLVPRAQDAFASERVAYTDAVDVTYSGPAVKIGESPLPVSVRSDSSSVEQ